MAFQLYIIDMHILCTLGVLVLLFCNCVCSLQRHLTQESEIKHQYERKLDQYKEQLEKAEQKIIHVSDELNHSIKERNGAIQSRNQLAQDLLTEQERSEK